MNNKSERYEIVYEAIKYGKMTDLMSGKGRYKFQNLIYGKFDPFEILEWLYYFDMNDQLLRIDIKKRFMDALNDFLKDESSVFKTGDLYLASLYFVCQCMNEDCYKKSSFSLDAMERNHYLLFLRDRIYKNEEQLMKATTSSGKNKWKEIGKCNKLLIEKTKCKVGFLTSKEFQLNYITTREELIYYALIHNELTDLLWGKDIYYYESPPWNTGPYNISEVLDNLYFWDKYYKGKLSVKNLFADALFSLANGNEDDIILAAKYFVYQLLEEIKNNASFRFDEDFKNIFVEKVSEKCAENEYILKNEVTVCGENKWQAIKNLHDILIHKIGFKRGFIVTAQ